MDVPELFSEELAQLFINGANDPSKRPVLILGAGASIPSLPSAYNLKVEIGSNAVKQGYKSTQDIEEMESALQIIRETCGQEHITLEVLVSLITFRSGDKLNTDAMWKALCEDCVVNEFSHMIAILIKLGCIGKILTSNFDHVLEEACHNVGAEFEVVSNVQLESNELNFYSNSSVTQICPFHGTTFSDTSSIYTGPFTATATGLAKPFSKRMAEYIEDSLSDQDRPIIVFGYSGSDHFDVNPLLSSMNLETPENHSNWFWCIHSGNGNYCSQAVRNMLGASTAEKLLQSNALYGADTLSVMKGAFGLVVDEVSPGISLPAYQSEAASSTYEERLETWFAGNFEWSGQNAKDMSMDLQNNLAAAWIVSEHYRLIQLGYDEEYCFRFAGIFDINTSSRDVGDYPHLALKFTAPNGEKINVEFGFILEAARIYRIEMNDEHQEFPVTGSAMNTFVQQAIDCIENNTARQDSEIAALYVGLSIAYDYLGLIGGRHVTKALKAIKKLKEDQASISEINRYQEALSFAREEASSGFEKCTFYASKAKECMNSSLDKLIPALMWKQVGLDNMGRFKIPGSDEAIEWLTKAIKGRKEMIQSDIQLSLDAGDTDVATSKVVSIGMHYPPLWRRGGELVQQVLETQGFNSAPNKLMPDLNEERKALAEFGYKTSEDAYDRFRELNKSPNLNFPAIYDVRVLMALAYSDITKARNEVRNCRSVLENMPKQDFAESKLKSTRVWIDNIEARIDDFILTKGHSGAEHANKDANSMTYQDLKSTLLSHFSEIDLCGKKGFYHMDKNDNKRVGANEIVKEMKNAGLDISFRQAHEMIYSFTRPSGELDLYGYLRWIS